MRVLLADDHSPQEATLRSMLEGLGHQVVGPAEGAREAALLARRGGAEVGVLALGGAVEAAERIARVRPLPLVLVLPERDAELVGRVEELPVFACLVEPVSAEVLSPAVCLAHARFEEWRALRARVVELSKQLVERKTVERAKGILMEVRGLSEGDAYRLLRRESQNRRRSLSEVASTVVSMEGVFRASAHPEQ